jgi:hypothetical protein
VELEVEAHWTRRFWFMPPVKTTPAQVALLDP